MNSENADIHKEYSDMELNKLVLMIKSLNIEIERLTSEIRLRDEKIFQLENQLHDRDVSLDHSKILSENSQNVINKNSFLRTLQLDSYDNSLLSLNDISINQCYSKKADLNSTINFRLNQVEINELSDEEMDDFLMKIKSVKVEIQEEKKCNDNLKKKNFMDENFTTFKIIDEKSILHSSDSKRKVLEFRKSLKDNEDQIISINQNTRSKVKNYIEKHSTTTIKDLNKSINNKQKINKSLNKSNKIISLDKSLINKSVNKMNKIIKTNKTPINREIPTINPIKPMINTKIIQSSINQSTNSVKISKSNFKSTIINEKLKRDFQNVKLDSINCNTVTQADKSSLIKQSPVDISKDKNKTVKKNKIFVKTPKFSVEDNQVFKNTSRPSSQNKRKLIKLVVNKISTPH